MRRPDVQLLVDIVQSAVVYQLLIIGEASSKLSEDLRARHPNVEWRGAIRTRAVMAHDHAALVMPLIWRTATESVPLFREQVKQILEHEFPDTARGNDCHSDSTGRVTPTTALAVHGAVGMWAPRPHGHVSEVDLHPVHSLRRLVTDAGERRERHQGTQPGERLLPDLVRDATTTMSSTWPSMSVGSGSGRCRAHPGRAPS